MSGLVLDEQWTYAIALLCENFPNPPHLSEERDRPHCVKTLQVHGLFTIRARLAVLLEIFFLLQIGEIN